MSKVTFVECPRDAFQGLPRFIPTGRKIEHLIRIVDAGIGEIDFGSFVSPKAVPQMADTADVLAGFRAARPDARVRLIAIVANERGLDGALSNKGVTAAGYPLSIADTFQRNNTNRSIEESWPLIENMQRRCDEGALEFHVYLSMAFGNPYNEPWSVEILAEAAARLESLGVRTILLADTIGCATPAQITESIAAVRARLRPDTLVGAHFHAAPASRTANIKAAWDAGCTRIDTSLGGFGGCPFAQDELVGNIPTEHAFATFGAMGIDTGLKQDKLAEAVDSARRIFEEFGHE